MLMLKEVWSGYIGAYFDLRQGEEGDMEIDRYIVQQGQEKPLEQKWRFGNRLTETEMNRSPNSSKK